MAATKRRTLTDYVSNKTEPRASVIAEICDLTGVDIDWLIRGGSHISPLAGAQKSASGLIASEALKQPSRLPKLEIERSDLETGLTRIPQFDINASAGPGALPGNEAVASVVSFETSFLRDLGARPDACSAIWVKGDSMEPTIPDRSVAIIDHSQTSVKNGCIYVLNVQDDLLVKRVRRKIDGTIELVSDNDRYPVEPIAPDRAAQLRVIGRVVYFCREP